MYVAIASLTASLPVFLCTLATFHSHFVPDSPFKNSRILTVASICAAWFLGLIFLCGGMSKLMPFPGIMGPVWLEEQLAKYGLGMFARFIAWSEAIIGILMLSRTTRALGAIMMVPLLLNIFMVTVSMNWRGTPWVIGFFLQLNLLLLAFYFDRWKSICSSNLSDQSDTMYDDRLGITLVCMVLILAGPVWFSIHSFMAIALITTGFLGLIGNSCLKRRSHQPFPGEKNGVDKIGSND